MEVSSKDRKSERSKDRKSEKTEVSSKDRKSERTEVSSKDRKSERSKNRKSEKTEVSSKDRKSERTEVSSKDRNSERSKKRKSEKTEVSSKDRKSGRSKKRKSEKTEVSSKDRKSEKMEISSKDRKDGSKHVEEDGRKWKSAADVEEDGEGWKSAAESDGEDGKEKNYKTYLVHSTSDDEKQLHLCYLVGIGESTGSVVVFTNSVASSVHLHKLTKLLGYRSEVLTSRLNNKRKDKVINNFVKGSNKILFSTNGNEQQLAVDMMIYFNLPVEHLKHTKAIKVEDLKHTKAINAGGTIVILGSRDEVGLIEAGVRTYPIDVSSLPTLEERLSKARQTISIKARAVMGQTRSESAQKRKAKARR